MAASQTKRVRVDGDTNGDGVASSVVLVAERAVALPADIGQPSAIAAWAPFAERHAALVVGTDGGGIAVLRDDGSATVLEAAGGAAIQALLAKTPTGATAGADPMPMPDVVAGDADGNVTVYTVGRRFSRTALPAPVSALAADTNPNAPSSFLVGDMGGAVASCHAQETIWRAHIDTATAAAGSLRAAPPVGQADPVVTAVCSVWQADKHGLLTNYVLAASGHGHVQLLSRGVPVHTIPLACVCTALCPGVFVGRGRATDDRRIGSGAVQAILGDESGRLFLLDNFELVPYARLDHPIVRVAALPLQSPGSGGGGASAVDAVVCQTSSDTVFVLHSGRVVATYTADFWPALVGVAAEFGGAGPVLAVADSGEMDYNGGGGGGGGGGASIHIVPLRPLLDSIG
ncbi:hypothetical protein H4R21_002971 [Coemansia helicoidea]|uniref:Uncharacterized protein n=1 Tax=Coemansia helicoidea TaxID=1286919 RepID=A0ACC1L3Y6_9FUNG|nr:hypothetical protein H4R21_002971 [Coemansia helicoidea]